MKNFLHISAFLTLFLCQGAADALCEQPGRDARLAEAVEERSRVEKSFSGAPYFNPALRGRRFRTSLSELTVGYDLRSEQQAYLLQQGDGHSLWRANVTSHALLSGRTTVWGYASYERGRKNNVKWNSTSDFMLIYPYITADSLGGDLEREEYRFGGGYFHQFGIATVGLEADIRALQEYRTVNPRPMSRISDVKFSAGAGLKLGRGYRAALSASGRAYEQNSNVAFAGDVGSIPEMLMLGLGNYLTNFTGEKDVRYKASALSASVDVAHIAERGVFFRGTFDRFSMERIATQQNQVPLNDLTTRTLTAQVGYVSSGRVIWGVKGTYCEQRREGLESIIGDYSGGQYPVLAWQRKFESSVTDKYISVVGGYRNHGFSVSVEPFFGVAELSSRYIYPESILAVGSTNAGAVLNVSKRGERVHLSGGVRWMKSTNKSGEHKIPVANMGAALVEVMQYTFGRLSSSLQAWNVEVRCDYGISARWGLTLSVSYGQQTFEIGGKTNIATIRAGIVFP